MEIIELINQAIKIADSVDGVTSLIARFDNDRNALISTHPMDDVLPFLLAVNEKQRERDALKKEETLQKAEPIAENGTSSESDIIDHSFPGAGMFEEECHNHLASVFEALEAHEAASVFEALEAHEAVEKAVEKDPFTLMLQNRYGSNTFPLANVYALPLIAYFGDHDPALIIRKELDLLFDSPFVFPDVNLDVYEKNLSSFIENGMNRQFVEFLYEMSAERLDVHSKYILNLVYEHPNTGYEIDHKDFDVFVRSITSGSNVVLTCAIRYKLGSWNDREFVRIMLQGLSQLNVIPHKDDPTHAYLSYEVLEYLADLTPRERTLGTARPFDDGIELVQSYSKKYTEARIRSNRGKALYPGWKNDSIAKFLKSISGNSRFDFISADSWDEVWMPDIIIFIDQFPTPFEFEEREVIPQYPRFLYDIPPNLFLKIDKIIRPFINDDEENLPDSPSESNSDDEDMQDFGSFIPPKMLGKKFLTAYIDYVIKRLGEERKDRLVSAIISFWLFLFIYRTKGTLHCNEFDSDGNYDFIFSYLLTGLGGRGRDIMLDGIRMSMQLAKQFEQERLAKRLEQYLPTEEEELLLLIDRGESLTLEFKETIRWDVNRAQMEAKNDKIITAEWLKAIAAFLNTEGGVLLLGVSDSKEIRGIDQKKEKFENDDETLRYIKDKLNEALGAWASQYVPFSIIDTSNGKVIRVDCKRSDKPAFLTLKNNFKGDFMVRQEAGSKKLTPEEMNEYLKARETP